MRKLPERKPIRLQGRDYGRNATYFITICTKNKQQYFGKIKNGIIHLSETGKIAQACWQEIPRHFQYISLGAYIIMPDHMHGVLIIDRPNSMVEMREMDSSKNGSNNGCGAVACNSPTTTITKAPKITQNDKMSSISPKSGSLSTIIRSYKSAVTKRAHLVRPDFSWQSLFFDHIIRNPESNHQIQQYIQANVKNWPKTDHEC